MKKHWTKTMLRTWLAAILLITLCAPAAMAAEKPVTYRMVSLGDSLTVGYEPGMDSQWKPYGFVDRLYEQGLYHGRIEVHNLGINGLKTGGLKNYVQAIADGNPITSEAMQPGLKDPRGSLYGAGVPAAKSLLQSANIITVTIGGNDLFSLIETAGSMKDEELTLRVQELFKAYTDNVGTTVKLLHSLNPEAVIVLSDQYQPVPEMADKAAYPKLMETASQLTKLIDGLAESFNDNGVTVKVAHVAKEFIGKELAMTHIAKRDIHPNQDGYEVMARVFAEAIWGTYKLPAAVEAGTPMTIVVQGKVLSSPYKPVLVKSRNYVALQDIAKAMGTTAAWSNKTSSATLTLGDRTVVIKMGADTIDVNGSPVSIDSPAFLHKIGKEHKTYVPLAALSEGLGFDVQYHAKWKTVFINP